MRYLSLILKQTISQVFSIGDCIHTLAGLKKNTINTLRIRHNNRKKKVAFL